MDKRPQDLTPAQRKQHRTCPILSTSLVFPTLLVVRLLSARFSIIADCDEVFNYWEPTHYLSHNHGLQTWEYSPEYAIRSWAYVGLHAFLNMWISYLPQMSKVHEFYALRCIFASICALCETRLYHAVSTNVSGRIGILYLVATVTSAGMFHAATAYLPSTFSMYTTMLGIATFIERPTSKNLKTVEGIAWFALGGLLGWPFSTVIVLPFIVQHLLVRLHTSGLIRTFRVFTYAAFAALGILVVVVTIDTWAYKQFQVVPLNIVLYNVFSGPGKGPEIYGTEPWWFYFANLALNFNILLPLALLCAPLLVFLHLLSIPSSQDRVSTSSLFNFSIQFYIWLAIFSSQAHKEERFMFVAYPTLCLSAATAFHAILSIWATISIPIPSRIRVLLKHSFLPFLNRGILIFPIAISFLLSISRVLAIVTGYSAPMHMYNQIPENAAGNLCLGKEWYRFPSSYFLPGGLKPKFVKSAFSGLLPGPFVEGKNGSWDRPGMWTVPDGMNDENREDISKYVDISSCDYLVDSYLPSSSMHHSSELEPNYILDTENWQRVNCEKFLDAGGTKSFVDRALWVPGASRRRSWGDYCLLKKVDASNQLEEVEPIEGSVYIEVKNEL